MRQVYPSIQPVSEFRSASVEVYLLIYIGCGNQDKSVPEQDKQKTSILVQNELEKVSDTLLYVKVLFSLAVKLNITSS